jgi:YhcH/YjgK/YiaL family protein
MIKGNLKTLDFYKKLFPKCDKAFDFLKTVSVSMENKKYEIADGIHAMIFDSIPKLPKDRKFEIHEKYIDVQYIIDGYDIIGFKPVDECGEIEIPYNEERDITFYGVQEPDYQVRIKNGDFVMIFPEEAHSPESGDRVSKKVVVKVRIDLLK